MKIFGANFGTNFGEIFGNFVSNFATFFRSFVQQKGGANAMGIAVANRKNRCNFGALSPPGRNLLTGRSLPSKLFIGCNTVFTKPSVV